MIKLSEIIHKKEKLKKLPKKFILRELRSALRIMSRIRPALNADPKTTKMYKVGGCSLNLAYEFLEKCVREIKEGRNEV